MNMEKRENYIKYLDKRISEIENHIKQLIRDNRRDDVNIEKTKANIFQTLKTVFQTSLRTSTDEEEQRKFFNGRLMTMEETWTAALAKAAERNLEARILQEQVKLEVIREARDVFEEMQLPRDVVK